jgi:hypothetical protein
MTNSRGLLREARSVFRFTLFALGVHSSLDPPLSRLGADAFGDQRVPRSAIACKSVLPKRIIAVPQIETPLV